MEIRATINGEVISNNVIFSITENSELLKEYMEAASWAAEDSEDVLAKTNLRNALCNLQGVREDLELLDEAVFFVDDTLSGIRKVEELVEDIGKLEEISKLEIKEDLLGKCLSSWLRRVTRKAQEALQDYFEELLHW